MPVPGLPYMYMYMHMHGHLCVQQYLASKGSNSPSFVFVRCGKVLLSKRRKKGKWILCSGKKRTLRFGRRYRKDSVSMSFHCDKK